MRFWRNWFEGWSRGSDSNRRVLSAALGLSLLLAVLYGCVAFGGIPYRSKTTLKFFKDVAAPTKAYSYEVSNIEVLKGIAASVALLSDKISTDVGILLNGVCDVNGMPLLAARK